MTTKQIVAMGGGGFSSEPGNPLLDNFVFSLTGKMQPKVCFMATASGDAAEYIRRFYRAMTPNRCVATHLELFSRDSRSLEDVLMDQDIIYVGGGNTANMLAIWRIHGVDAILREAWERGIVLCGVSAGCICWFDAGSTDSFGPLAPLNDGLGLLPGSACPHYDGEIHRRDSYQQMIADGFPPGYAFDDGAAGHFVGAQLQEAIASRENAKAYRVERDSGITTETVLPTRYLG